MYSSHMLGSDTFFGAHPPHSSYQAYGSHPNFTSQFMSPRDRYYHALAEARSAELEMLEDRAGREEVLLQRRLQELRQARVKQLRRNPPYAPYFIGHTPDGSPPYNRGYLETLKLQLQEKEQLGRLEAIQRNILELQGGGLGAVAEDYSNSRGISLPEAGLLHKLGIFQQEDISHPSPVVTNEDSFPISSLGCIPARSFIGHTRIKHLHSQKKPIQSGDLASRLNARRLHSGMFAVNQTEELPQVPFQPRIGRQNEPPVASTPTDLNGVLEQLELFAPKNARHQYGENFTHRSKGSNGREENSGIQSQGLAGTHLFTKTESPKQEKHEKHSFQESQSLDANLRKQIESRLNAEHENEVRDTIAAVLNSLYDILPTSVGAETSSTSSPRPLAKGKEKEYTPSPGSKKHSSSELIDNAGLQIKDIEKQFYALEREFMFPTNLDFITPIATRAGSSPATSCLSFTASNQPIRFFEQSLSQLLIRLDLIESQGNEELRNKRKDIVQKVEQTLEDLENEVEARLKAKLASESKRRSVTIEDVTSPDEHLGTEVVSSSPRIDAKTDSVSGSSHPTPAVVGETAETLSSPSTQVSIGESTTAPNLVDEESPNRDLGGQECIAVKSHAQEAVLQIIPSDVVPSKTGADSPTQPPISLELECSESKEVRAAEDCDSDPNVTTGRLADQIQTQTIIQEPPSTEPQNAAAAMAGLPGSAGSDAHDQPQNVTNEAERKRLSVEETSDISDVESASSDWSEVDAAVAR